MSGWPRTSFVPLRARLAELVAQRRRPGAVDGLAVHLEPLAGGAQHVTGSARGMTPSAIGPTFSR